MIDGPGPDARADPVVAGPRRAEILPRCRFPRRGSAVTCAVSGGADSLALLLLAVDAGLDVTAVHVDHGLRPGSAAEAGLVEEVATRVGARFRPERVEIAPGGDLEARARSARRAVLPAGTLYGHTADDQAETVLLALLRGAGLDGLRGMHPDGHPLLDVRRSETAAICDEAGIVPFRDPSNHDLRFRRNRVRHELVPLLDTIAERDVTPLLVRMARLVLDDVDLLDEIATGLDPTDAVAVAAAPVAVARRTIRQWLRAFDAECHPPDAAAVDRVLAVARGEARAAQVAGGIEIRRSQQRLVARRLCG